jgi:hypothetical protein
LHFGLACQQARADGIENVDILPVCDDVSVARSKGALVGRRVLAGTTLGMSIYFILCRIVLSFFSSCFFKFQKLSALLQKLTGLSTLSSNLAKPSPEPSLRLLAHSTIAMFQDAPNTPLYPPKQWKLA